MTDERFAEIDELLDSDDVGDDFYDLVEMAMDLRDEVKRIRGGTRPVMPKGHSCDCDSCPFAN